MRRQDFQYHLPESLIAQHPPDRRDGGRLLSINAAKGAWRDTQMTDLPNLLDSKDLVVFNDTRVIAARLFGHKQSGGRVEILIERVRGETRATAQLRSSKTPKPGTQIHIDGHSIVVLERVGGFFLLEFSIPLFEMLEQHGHIPLPPYIQREDERSDQERYQTLFAANPGAVAAPTAGLHFSEQLLQRLDSLGVETAFVTLHVGAGTFQPMRTERLADHIMHSEQVHVDQTVVRKVASCRARRGRVIAVGTTTVRSLETAALDGEMQTFSGESRLFLYPGSSFNVVDAMLTNFHLPESTLLMLVCAFAGKDLMLRAYAHAVQERYRFFSYGDACFVTRQDLICDAV